MSPGLKFAALLEQSVQTTVTSHGLRFVALAQIVQTSKSHVTRTEICSINAKYTPRLMGSILNFLLQAMQNKCRCIAFYSGTWFAVSCLCTTSKSCVIAVGKGEKTKQINPVSKKQLNKQKFITENLCLANSHRFKRLHLCYFPGEPTTEIF